MDKYSVLLFGKNQIIINDFFAHRDERLECLSASSRSEDLMNHLKYFTPDALVYCMQEERPEDMQQVLLLRAENKSNVPLAVIGQESECAEFMRDSANAADYLIDGSLSVSRMQEEMIRFLTGRRNGQGDGADKPRKHILVIDDDPLMLKVMKENLRNDYEVAAAISGKVAMKYLSKKSADLIFLDYQMPDESGPEVLEKLSQNEATKDIPVYFLTGVKDEEKIQKAMSLKPSGYLQKPIERGKLLEVLEKQFSGEEDL